MEANRAYIERSDGATLALGDGSEWILALNDLDGWLTVTPSVNTQASVLKDGSYVVSKRVAATDRTIRAVYHGSDRVAAQREITSFFNPKHTFRVHMTYRGRTRWCEGEQLGFMSTMAREDTPTDFTWTIICPQPYMLDEDGNDKPFGASVAGIGFPYVSHLASDYDRPIDYPAGVHAGSLVFDGRNTVYNSGDVATYYSVEIRARGSLINPTITKDDRFIRLETTMSDGDVALIDLESRPPMIWYNGEKAFRLASRDSSFVGMEMQVGPSVFSFSIDNEENRSLAQVHVLFNKKYLGV